MRSLISRGSFRAGTLLLDNEYEYASALTAINGDWLKAKGFVIGGSCAAATLAKRADDPASTASPSPFKFRHRSTSGRSHEARFGRSITAIGLGGVGGVATAMATRQKACAEAPHGAWARSCV